MKMTPTNALTHMPRGEGDELWFVSRKKDIIIRGGTSISPAEMKKTLVAASDAVPINVCSVS